jgi:outer membrane biosynthesis protein TonB
MTGNRPKLRPDDAASRALALGTTVVLHVGVAVGVLWGSAGEAPAVVVEPPIMVDPFVELPKLGEERDPKLLQRIVQAPQPEAATAPVNLNQKREEEPEPTQEKKPDEREKPVDVSDPEAEKKKAEEERKRRQKEIAQAMAQFDERADEDSPEGLRDGFKEGTSTQAATLREESLWAAQVGARIREYLQPPAGISPGECRRLASVIPIVLSAEGKVTNAVKIAETSGNGFFDDAAVRAVRQFTDEGRGTLPLPRADRLGPLRKKVMREGVPVRLECAQ